MTTKNLGFLCIEFFSRRTLNKEWSNARPASKALAPKLDCALERSRIEFVKGARHQPGRQQHYSGANSSTNRNVVWVSSGCHRAHFACKQNMVNKICMICVRCGTFLRIAEISVNTSNSGTLQRRATAHRGNAKYFARRLNPDKFGTENATHPMHAGTCARTFACVQNLIVQRPWHPKRFNLE